MADTDILTAAKPLADLLDGGHGFVSVKSPEAAAFLAAVRASYPAPPAPTDVAPEYVAPPPEIVPAGPPVVFPGGRFGEIPNPGVNQAAATAEALAETPAAAPESAAQTATAAAPTLTPETQTPAAPGDTTAPEGVTE